MRGLQWRRVLRLVICLGCGCSSLPDGPSVTLRGQVQDALGGRPLAMVEVCVLDREEIPCVQTDVLGAFVLSYVPSEADVALRLTAPDYVAGLVPFSTTIEDATVAPVSLITETLLQLQSGATGVERLAATGVLPFSISNGINGDRINVAGVQVSLQPDVGDGPFYTTMAGIPTSTLSETSVNGGGVFVNIPSGDYILRHEGTPGACETLLGWGEPNALRIPIRAEHVSFARIVCPEATND